VRGDDARENKASEGTFRGKGEGERRKFEGGTRNEKGNLYVGLKRVGKNPPSPSERRGKTQTPELGVEYYGRVERGVGMSPTRTAGRPLTKRQKGRSKWNRRGRGLKKNAMGPRTVRLSADRGVERTLKQKARENKFSGSPR